MRPELVAVGHIVNEMIDFPHRTIGPVLGSPVAYSSVAAASLGTKVGIVTRIGSDMPRELLEPFIEAGVDTEGLVNRGPDTTTSILRYNEAGEKQILYPKRAPSISFEDIPESYREARCFYVCTMDREVPLETIAQIKHLGVVLAVDLGGYGGAHSQTHPSEDEKRNPERLKELVSMFDIVRASVEDCGHLLGTKPQEIEGAARRFVDWGAGCAVITLGSEGSLGVAKDHFYRVPAMEGNIVDTTGAGDSYSGGFLVEYLKSGDILRAMRFANAVAHHVCGGTGGVTVDRMPRLSDIYIKLEGFHGRV